MNEVRCPYCGNLSVVRKEPYCNEYHEHAHAASRTNLLSVIKKRKEEDPEFAESLHKLMEVPGGVGQ